ncbi:5'-nucleotidase C-terminal domain-containing protein, partial [Ralstonia pickettii]|nr:5'-nucleotidase C-terminal domain-containing protein [Ralstonia pickettii]
NANDKWMISNKNAELKTFEDIHSDEAILSYLAPLEQSTQEWLDQPIGFIKGDMTISNPLQARLTKHPFIQFIQDVQMEESGAAISVTSLLNNSSTGFPSTVTMRDIVSNYMFPNTLVVLELTGADIKAALEQTAQYFILNEDGEITVNPAYIYPKPQHYNYDMWEGIEYILNISKPIGERVEKLLYQGDSLHMDKTYQAVFNNYRASGGGDYAMFKGKKVIKDIQKDAVELIQAYFEKYQTIEAKIIDNFKVIK